MRSRNMQKKIINRIKSKQKEPNYAFYQLEDKINRATFFMRLKYLIMGKSPI